MPTSRTVAVSQLRPGLVLAAPVFDEQNIKLLNTGTHLNAESIEVLRSRRITEVLIEYLDQTTDAARASARREGGNKVVDHCSGCGRDILLLGPAPGFTARPWVCEKCG